MMNWIAIALMLASFCQSAPVAEDNCDHVGCISVWQPVCGNDGKTYGSTCELTIAKCSNPTLTVAHPGECGGNPFVDGGRRLVDNCLTILCFALYDPVCGSDGRTYGNSCELGRAQCLDSTVTGVHSGSCKLH